jgi:hypothetical protein
VRELLEDIRERVLIYYSNLNWAQASPQIAATQENPSKPEELILLDDLGALKLPFVGGGYVDQPWLLMQMLTVAAQARQLAYQSRDEVTASD